MALTPGADEPGLISYMQRLAERDKTVLARELHDELGGLLVAASMDLAWLDRHLMPSQECRRRLDRLKDTLGGAVDIKRRIIEELRPTLLDNVGLFAALRWYVDNTCARADLESDIRFPPSEPCFSPEASIALFRIAQESLALVMERRWVRSVILRLENCAPRFTLSVSGRGNPPDSETAEPNESFDVATIRHRSETLGGGIRYACDAGTVKLDAWLPIENTIAR